MTHFFRRGHTAVGVVAVASVLALTGCSSTDGSNDKGSAAGVAAGATKAEYEAAFKDIEPITIVAQTSGPKGFDTFGGSKEEAYMDAIHEWSGGKISFDISYGYAIAPINEAADAVAEGRMDMATTLPSADPSEYPVFNEFAKGTVIAKDGSPVVGPLLVNAYMLDAGYQIPELAKEFESHGLHMVFPAYNLVPQGVFCSKKRSSMADLKGSIISVSSTYALEDLKAVGAKPTSIPYTEAFEGLQRGTIDCAATAVTITTTTGVSDPAPYGMVSPNASFGSSPGAFVVNEQVWQDLPLVAQQLFFDRAVDFYQWYAVAQISELAKAIKTAQGHGGGIFPVDDEVSAAIKASSEKIFDQIRSSKLFSDPDKTADVIRQAEEKWYKIVTTDLGFDADMSFDDLPAWLEQHGGSEFGQLKLPKYLDMLSKEIFDKHRPS